MKEAENPAVICPKDLVFAYCTIYWTADRDYLFLRERPDLLKGLLEGGDQ